MSIGVDRDDVLEEHLEGLYELSMNTAVILSPWLEGI